MAEKTFYAIVTQFDTTPERAAQNMRDFPEQQHGPLLYECYLLPEHQDLAVVEGISKRFASNGWLRIAKVIVDIPDGEE